MPEIEILDLEQYVPNPISNEYPDFKPCFTPKQMLQLGVFGGTALNSISVRDRIPINIIREVNRSQFTQMIPVDTINYYKQSFPKRFRPNKMPPDISRMHPGGWFEWFCRFSEGFESIADRYRINQWKDELLVLSYYIRNSPANPSKQENFMDNNVPELVKWRQYLLEYAWHPNLDPLDFKIL